MNFLSTRVHNTKPSLIFAMIQKAKELTAIGHDVINLAGGEPDFLTPSTAQSAAIQAINSGQTFYTAIDGTLQLKKAIQEKFKNQNNLSYSLDEIMASTGAKQVLYNAFMATLNCGDEVIIPTPYWTSYPEMVALAEGQPVLAETYHKDGFKLTPQTLESLITPRTKWLLLNSPNNPTGAVYTSQELKNLGEILLKHPHVHIMSDDIYEHIIFDNRKFHTLAEVMPQLKERTLTINGVSKAYAMTGWRIGYAGGPKTLISAMKTIQSQSTSCPCSIAQAAAEGALTQSQHFLEDWNQSYQQRRNFIVDKLNQIPGIHCPAPDGAFYVLASCKDILGRKTPENKILNDDREFVTYLLESVQVAAIPGIVFGAPGYFRLAFSVASQALQKACERIFTAVSRLKE